MSFRWPRRVVFFVGFALGATAGGWIGWSVGYAAWHWTGGSDLTWGVLFFLSFVGVLFGLVAPLTLVRYVSDRTAPLGGEAGDAFMADSWAANYVVDMALSRQLGNYTGYLAIVAFYLALAGIAGYYFGGTGFDSLEVLALFDAVGGAVLGGIAIVSLISRKVRPVGQ
ncbi:MAG: hypothetical protein ABEH59_02190 [Halobacteriales archaeon]